MRSTGHAIMVGMRTLDGVVRQVASELGVLGADDSLTSMKSLVIVELVILLEEQLGIDLFQPQFRPDDFRSVATVVAMIRRDTATPSAEIDTDGGDGVARAETSSNHAAAELALAALVRGWTDVEVVGQLAVWSNVQLPTTPAMSTPFDDGPRRQLFDRLVAQHRIDVDVAGPLAHRIATTTEASFTQRQVWAIHELGDTARLGQAHGVAIRGPLELDAMRRASAALVVRQPALRTVFSIDGDRVMQHVGERGPELEVVDLSAYPDAERMPRARRLFDELGRPHDLRRQPFRMQLVRLDDREHLVFIAAHHMVADGFSFGVLWSDLDALYRAAVSGAAPALPALDFEFADYCFWQRSLEQRPVGTAQLAFWSNAVAGYEDLVIPGERATGDRVPGRELAMFVGGEVAFVIDDDRWTAVLATCARLKVLPYHLIATAFYLLLARCGGRREVLVMGPAQARRRRGSEKVIGTFATPYLIRIRFDDDLTLALAVQHFRDTALVFHEHQGVAPTPALARWSELLRYNLNYYQMGDAEGRTLGDATTEPLGWSIASPGTMQDLALHVGERATRAGGTILYNAQRFSPALASKLADRLHWIIGEIVTDSAQRVGALPRMP